LTENAAKIVPRANAPRYDPVFLAKALQTPFAQDQISSHVGQVTIGKLALFRIEKLRLPLPPIEAQRRFARITEAVARLKQSHEASAAEANKLFASLQHHAFTGQLS
jgi:type I restriction enzyme S subunit